MPVCLHAFTIYSSTTECCGSHLWARPLYRGCLALLSCYSAQEALELAESPDPLPSLLLRARLVAGAGGQLAPCRPLLAGLGGSFPCPEAYLLTWSGEVLSGLEWLDA